MTTQNLPADTHLEPRVLRTIGRYFKEKFGTRVRKIPISLQGFTCPNIDGTKSRGGCIYCRNESFSPSLKKLDSSIKTKMHFNLIPNPILQTQISQLEDQFYWHANFHKDRFDVQKYVIYFQSFSNTYAPLDTLKALYEKALSLPNVVGMSIGTRIDCIQDELLDLLASYVEQGFDIWLEYGIQSVFDSTLQLINRAETMEIAPAIFKATKQRGIQVCAHLIYGLPGESHDMMLHSLKSVLSWGVDALKIHPLYVLENTRLAQMYKKGEYTPITLQDYGNLIVESLKIIPPEIIIQRISSGANEQSLLAPKWCFDKNIQMRYLRDLLSKINIQY